MAMMIWLSHLVLGNLEIFFYWYNNWAQHSAVANLLLFHGQVGTEGDQISLGSDHIMYSHHCCGLPWLSQLQAYIWASGAWQFCFLVKIQSNK